MPRSATMFAVYIAAACFFSLVISPIVAGNNLTESCIAHERDALLAFKEGITNNTNILASWNLGQDCCQWKGVTCSNKTGHVVELDLSRTSLVGQISPSLLSLEFLEYLDLSDTNLRGPRGHVPEFFGSMSNLRYLDLSFIQFSGGLPPSIGNISKLEYLDLYDTSLIGRVPPHLGNLSNLQYLGLSSSYNQFYSHNQLYSTDITWLTRLHFLEYLDMGSVNLSSVTDWLRVLNGIPSLDALYLYDCSLQRTNQSLPHLNLTKLTSLDLSGNYFNQAIGSCWFWNITSIEHLELVDTKLHGPFPNSLGNMTSLQFFDFSSNGNSATIVNMKDLCALTYLNLDWSLSPGASIADFFEKLPQCASNNLLFLSLNYNSMIGILPKRIEHLTSLDSINLAVNNISGAIPPWIWSLNLRILDLSYNNLIGSTNPGIENFTNLQYLSLSHNYFTGHVPTEISMLKYLTFLDLSNNNFKGVFREGHFATLRRLHSIDLSHNSFEIVVSPEWRPPFELETAHFASCPMGPRFPTWLKYQGGIRSLDLSNTGIIDMLPDWFFHTFWGANYLDLSNNQISGTLPANMTAMPLLALFVNSNNLSGQIPLLPTGLLNLDLSQNSFSGPLPPELGAQGIMELILSSNYLTGHIPESLCGLQDLFVLDLSNNFLDGELARCFGMPRLVFLLLSNNKYSGKFPALLESCSSLAFLDLSRNNLSGNLPVWIGDMVSLRFLQLSHNKFNGDIPITIMDLKRLRHLILADNNLSGAIPSSILRLSAMTQKHPKRPGLEMSIWYSDLIGTFSDVLSVVLKRQELKYGAGIFDMIGIDLSLNQLTGVIPDQITSLNGLLNLNLSWNHLVGQVPEKIGAMKLLESLDLSRNNLSGEIPPSLSDLTYLSYFDISYNNLTGRIPQGRQLDTLYAENPSMYNGNDGLCGPPLHRNCSGNNSPESGSKQTREVDFEPIYFKFGLGLGFMVGLWFVFCVMLFNTGWRISYYYFIDRIYNKLYVLVVVAWARLAREATTD